VVHRRNLGHVKRAAGPFPYSALKLDFWFGSRRSATAFSAINFHVHIHVNDVHTIHGGLRRTWYFYSHPLSMWKVTFPTFPQLHKVPGDARHHLVICNNHLIGRRSEGNSGPATDKLDKLSLQTSDLRRDKNTMHAWRSPAILGRWYLVMCKFRSSIRLEAGVDRSVVAVMRYLG
jgi:hypothetical protein